MKKIKLCDISKTKYREDILEKNIKDFNLEQLKQELVKLGEKPFRGEQIFQWIYKEKANTFDDMTSLSIELRNKLKENFTLNQFNILKKQVSKDGTIKYLFDVLDGNAIETVLMQYKFGKYESKNFKEVILSSNRCILLESGNH